MSVPRRSASASSCRALGAPSTRRAACSGTAMSRWPAATLFSRRSARQPSRATDGNDDLANRSRPNIRS